MMKHDGRNWIRFRFKNTCADVSRDIVPLKEEEGEKVNEIYAEREIKREKETEKIISPSCGGWNHICFF